MSLSVDIEIDRKQVRELFNSLKPKQVRKVAQQAINKTLKNSKADVNRQIRQDRAISKPKQDIAGATPVKLINKHMSVKKAYGLSSLGNVSGSINISRKGLSLIRYNARITKQGISVRIKKSGGKKLIKGAFIAKLKHGNIHVAKRVGKKKVKSLYSTNIADAATNKLAVIEKHMRERFSINLNAAFANAVRRSR